MRYSIDQLMRFAVRVAELNHGHETRRGHGGDCGDCGDDWLDRDPMGRRLLAYHRWSRDSQDRSSDERDDGACLVARYQDDDHAGYDSCDYWRCDCCYWRYYCCCCWCCWYCCCYCRDDGVDGEDENEDGGNDLRGREKEKTNLLAMRMDSSLLPRSSLLHLRLHHLLLPPPPKGWSQRPRLRSRLSRVEEVRMSRQRRCRRWSL